MVGCGTCVTVCLAGGEREVGIASYALRMARKIDANPLELNQVTIERQCENEFIKELADLDSKAEAIVSFGCGDCMLGQFGGVCPVTRCAKRLLNDPCGGSTETQCEVDTDHPCACQLIFARLKATNQLDRLETIVPPKDRRPARHGGARKIVRKEHRV